MDFDELFQSFTHLEEVLPFIPRQYLILPDHKCWFNTTPKFSTIRVDTTNNTVQEVIEEIRSQFETDRIPNIYPHEVLKDCIIVESFRNDHTPTVKRGTKYEVIVDVACGNAVLRGADIFSPGILGMRCHVQQDSLVDIYVDLEGKCLKGYLKEFKGKKLYIGSGIAQMSRRTIFDHHKKSEGLAVKVTYRLSNTPSFIVPRSMGLLQNLPSILCSHVLDVRSELLVLDMCAAPGNKTTHLSSLMNNEGNLIAVDRSKNKVKNLKNLCDTLDLNNVTVFCYDSTKMVSVAKTENNFNPPFPVGSFDRILVDAPCSGLGRRPQLKNTITGKHIESHPVIQKKLLATALSLLKPKGFMVYSTCSITTEENEDIVAWALNKFPNLSLVDAEPRLGSPGLPECGLNEGERQLVQRFGAGIGDTPENDTIGFFIAKFTKLDDR